MRGSVGVAPGTTTLQLPNGQTVALADWIDDKLYGSVQLANSQSTPVEAYSAGRSQTIPGGTRVQTRVDTNIPRNGDSGLPKDWEMLVYGWACRPIRAMRANSSSAVVLADGSGALSDPVKLTALFGIDRLVSLSYEYNGKSYSQGVMTDYPQGSGYSVFSTANNFELAQNGIPSPRDRVALVLPVHERENLGYKCVFQPEASLSISQTASDASTALTYIDVKMYKFGLIKRTVV